MNKVLFTGNICVKEFLFRSSFDLKQETFCHFFASQFSSFHELKNQCIVLKICEMFPPNDCQVYFCN